MDERIIKEVLKEVVDLCLNIEEGLRCFREKIVSIALETTSWKIVESPVPLDPEDRALKWLERRLKEVRDKHPEVKTEWIKDGSGKIRGLKYYAPDEEVEGDILGPTKWSFEKAAQRSVSTSNKS